ncbi:MAG: flavodoxin [Clostridiales bacterium]|nr:flavodoxin [Clostridiales bacterium]
MTVAVRYFSKSGNTEKLAKAIATEAGVHAENVSVPLAVKTDVLFLGSALYAGGVDKAVKKFLIENKDNIGTVYNFSTSASPSSTYKAVKKIADKNGITVSDVAFDCRGKFLFMHKGHPDEGDVAAAVEFAKKVLYALGEESVAE